MPRSEVCKVPVVARQCVVRQLAPMVALPQAVRHVALMAELRCGVQQSDLVVEPQRVGPYVVPMAVVLPGVWSRGPQAQPLVLHG